MKTIERDIMPSNPNPAAVREHALSNRALDDYALQQLTTRLRQCEAIRPECVNELLERMRTLEASAYMPDLSPVFDEAPCLCSDAKRKLGLDPQMTYSQRFVNYFVPGCLDHIEPRTLVRNICMDALYRARRRKALSDLKEAADVQYVRIQRVIHEDHCCRSAVFSSIHPIDRAPELPLPQCRAPVCQCAYQAVLPD